MSSFIIYALCQILLRLSNQGEIDSLFMYARDEKCMHKFDQKI
jgi:hypothetical protein